MYEENAFFIINFFLLFFDQKMVFFFFYYLLHFPLHFNPSEYICTLALAMQCNPGLGRAHMNSTSPTPSPAVNIKEYRSKKKVHS